MTVVDSQLKVGPNTEITLHFALCLGDGSEIDSTFTKQPATFRFGDGSLLPGFEAAMTGLTVGSRETFSIPPEHGFGERNPKNMHQLPKSQFPKDMALTEGVMVDFATGPSGYSLPGVVKEVGVEQILVDFNHPLAGRELAFTVEIIDIQIVDELDVSQTGKKPISPVKIDIQHLTDGEEDDLVKNRAG